MNISILGFSVNLEILILIGVVYLILVLNTVCSCCNMPKIMETMKTMSKINKVKISVSKNK
jgi:hypothetical protein